MAYKDSYKYSLNRHNLNRLLFINDSHTTDTSSELFLSLPERPIFDVDVTRYDNRYIVTIDLPGMSKNNITVEVEKEILTITTNRDTSIDTSLGFKGYSVRERRHGRFARSIRLDGAVCDGVNARYDNGVLTVEIPLFVSHKPGYVIEIK